MRNSSNAPTAHDGSHRDPRINTVDPAISRRQLEDALASLKEQVIRCPGDPLAHNNLGVIYCRLADKEHALASFQRAVDLAPSDLTMRKNLAFFLSTEYGNHEAALKIYTEILAESPYDADTLQAIASICTTLGDRKSAFFFHKKAIIMEPWNNAAWEFMEGVIEQGLANQRSVTDAVAQHTGVISATTLHELALASHEILNKATGAVETDRPRGGNISHPCDCAQQPAVSIVIPLFNKVELTAQCLKALEAKTDPSLFELILVDNGSADGTGALLATLPATVTVIRNERNLGFAKACNQGAAVAKGGYLLFLNNDTEPQHGWLEPLLTMIESDATIGAVGSKLLFPDGSIQHAGVLVLEDQKMPDLLVARHVFYGQPADLPDANRPMAYQVLTAACLLVRADAFRQVGGFDEGYWNGYEDVDLCFKLREQGWQLAYQPASVVIHHESKSGKERFTKVNNNIQRLHDKWLGKVRPDAVIDPQGGWHWIQDDLAWHGLTRTVKGDGVRQLSTEKTKSVGLVTIVILTFNQLWCTKECVESIQKHTPEPHEIVFVDNGSSDGTVDWLREQLEQHDNYRLIENGNNFGFAKGCNQGIEAAGGEYILLLNNDVVVTTDWLAGLLECYQRKDRIGIVGPMTNNISGIQRVEDVGYETVAGLNAYATSFRQRNRYRMIENRRVVGFCMLFSKQVAEEVGLLDETFGSGNFEDDDYCLRAELACYRNYIAGDVFIHHYGSQTFSGNKMDYGQAMQNNMALYRQKWNYKQLDEAVLRRLIPLDAVVESRRLAQQQGDIDKAIDLLMQQGIRIAPDNPVSYKELGELLIREGRFQDALEVLPEMPSDTDQAMKRELEAICHCALGDNDTAGRAAGQAAGRPRAMVVLGTLAARQGDPAEAERQFCQAIAVDPSCGSGWLSLGMLLWGQGKHDEAFAALKRAVTVDPLNREAVQILRDMAERLDAGLAPCNTSIG